MAEEFEVIIPENAGEGENENTQTIFLKGPVNFSTSHVLKNYLGKVLSLQKDIVFDLSEVNYVDSSGVAVFILITKELMAKNRKMYLKNANESIKSVIKFCKLDSVFKMI